MPEDKNRVVGQVVSVQGPVVDVKFFSLEDLPNVYDALVTRTVFGENVVLEVTEHLPGNIAHCIAISSTMNIKRESPVQSFGGPIQIPVGDGLYGRIINILGEPLDQKGEIVSVEKRSIRRPEMGSHIPRAEQNRKAFG